MALTKCNTCKGMVSKKATACPHCGEPRARGILGRGGIERAVHLGVLSLLVGISLLILFAYLVSD